MTKRNQFIPVITKEVRLKDGETLTLRPARPSDAAAWLELSRTVWAERLYTVTESSTMGAVQQETLIRAADDRELYLLAEAAGLVLGVLTAHPYMRGRSPKVQHVAEFGMSVRREARGRGIGTAMLAYLDLWAVTRTYEKLCLSVFSTNDRALALYRKMGYREEGRRVGQFRFEGRYIDEVLMGKPVGPASGV